MPLSHGLPDMQVFALMELNLKMHKIISFIYNNNKHL